MLFYTQPLHLQRFFYAHMAPDPHCADRVCGTYNPGAQGLQQALR